MQTKIVYSLISNDKDCYLDQLLLSVQSLRYYNPHTEVIVVCDASTELSLVGYRAQLRDMVNDIKVIDIPAEYNNMQRSRYLKTNLRKFIKGDYLFIDTDTIICSSLKSIDKIKGDIALATDLNSSLPLYEPYAIERCKQCGFDDMTGKPYFNSGVMLVRDTPRTHRLYDLWYEHWREAVSRGINLDQPSLNYSNNEMGNVITHLHDGWNCQIYFEGWGCLPQAKILHYAGGGKSDVMECLYAIVRTHGVEHPMLLEYIRHPRTKFYTYLTSQSKAFISQLLLRLYVHASWLYKLIVK